jgi:hypothetical protein
MRSAHSLLRRFSGFEYSGNCFHCSTSLEDFLRQGLGSLKQRSRTVFDAKTSLDSHA